MFTWKIAEGWRTERGTLSACEEYNMLTEYL